jgi:cobalt-zinc-cadmium efflux system protein
MAHVHVEAEEISPGGAGPAAVAARRARNRRRMLWAAAINGALVVGGIIGGVLTGSLALLADAAHVLSDLGAIGLAIVAAGLAARPGGSRRTFGYQRSEVLAGLVNGLVLAGMAIGIVIVAIVRLSDPPEVDGTGVLVLGFAGLAGNLAAAWVLARGNRADINLEAVLRHSAADALGSLGVIVSATVILATGWRPIDPIASIAISVLVLAASVRLIRDPLDVLMEAAPAGLDPDSLARGMCQVRGVHGVHELHVWSVTSGFEALAAHVVIARGEDRDRARRELEYLLSERYGIEHTTLQMEEEADPGALLQVDPEAGRHA